MRIHTDLETNESQNNKSLQADPTLSSFGETPKAPAKLRGIRNYPIDTF